jgi:imidazoleglycerol-phosphate dehydratase / histidinol-phosphatase
MAGKKILFIDRDGTLIKEAPPTYQIDSFEKLEFYPGVFKYLRRIVEELDYDLVMVTNQDGLGTASFPESGFWPVQNFVLKSFENEQVYFKEVLIDKTLPAENAATRKPATGLLVNYLDNTNFDLINSFVIGDRLSDMQLAKNLGCKGCWLNNDPDLQGDDPGALRDVIVLETKEWSDIYEKLSLPSRAVTHQRYTNETKLKLKLDLDGTGTAVINTGLAFFDHMLDQLARHGGFDLELSCKGDLQVDEHHTIEDTAIALGETFYKALGDKRGIERYGFLLPMDDCLAQVALDFGGRSWLVWKAEFKREKIGDMPTEMFMHFFKSFSDAARCNLNIEVTGSNEHHKIESIFKAFAKALKMAVKKQPGNNQLPSTKGIL